MRAWIRCAPAFAGILLFGFAARAESPRQLTVAAPRAVLIEYPSGRVLFEKQADVPMAPASLTKLMTLLVVFDALKAGTLKPDAELKLSAAAARQTGATLKLPAGSKLTLRQAIDAVALASANDAAVALAEATAGNERKFAERMNARAKALGLAAHFVLPTGHHDKQQKVTARAVAGLVVALLREYPDEYRLFAKRDFVLNGVKYTNRNPVLDSVAGADGVKTGQNNAAGYTLAASALRDGRRLILVLGGNTDEQARAGDAMRALEWGFAQPAR